MWKSGGKLGHSLTTTGVEINDSSQTLFISSSNFKVKHTGEITGSRVLFSAGKIAGWTIDGDVLSAGNVSLTGGPAASIKLGNLLNATGTGTTRKGFMADNDGNVLIKGSTSGNNLVYSCSIPANTTKESTVHVRIGLKSDNSSVKKFSGITLSGS